MTTAFNTFQCQTMFLINIFKDLSNAKILCTISDRNEYFRKLNKNHRFSGKTQKVLFQAIPSRSVHPSSLLLFRPNRNSLQSYFETIHFEHPRTKYWEENRSFQSLNYKYSIVPNKNHMLADTTQTAACSSKF